MAHVAIVGAGLSGLSAAYAIEQAGHRVTFFEKSRGVGGRAATRRHDGCRYDHGANYFKVNDQVHDLILDVLPTEDLITLERPVWTFNAQGRLHRGDDAHNQEPRYGYRQGINRLAKLLYARLDAQLYTKTRVQRIEAEANTWRVVTKEGTSYGPFDAVLLTPPGPQTFNLLKASTLPEAANPGALLHTWAESRYQSQFSCVFGLNHRIPFPFSALLNTDRQHAIAWLQVEHAKKRHVPNKASVLVVQMSPAWTEEYFAQDRDVVVASAWPITKHLLGIEQSQFLDWADLQRWRYALPTNAVDAEALRQGEAAGLYFASDALLGKGRVEGVMVHGAAVGHRLVQQLSE